MNPIKKEFKSTFAHRIRQDELAALINIAQVAWQLVYGSPHRAETCEWIDRLGEALDGYYERQR